MRTTLNLDENLMREVKERAARTGRTITSIVEDALRVSLRERPAGNEWLPARLTTIDGRGPLPGVDLDDSATLSELIESRSEWITTDGDFARFPGLRWSHPLQPGSR